MAVSTNQDKTGIVVAPRVLSIGTDGYAHTGDTNETSVLSYTLPAGSMSADSVIRITSFWSHTSNANNKTMRIDFGGTNYMSATKTTGGWWQQLTIISSDNSVSAQKAISASIDGLGSAGSQVTSAVDTTANVTIDFTVELANAADTATLETYVIELIK